MQHTSHIHVIFSNVMGGNDLISKFQQSTVYITRKGIKDFTCLDENCLLGMIEIENINIKREKKFLA